MVAFVVLRTTSGVADADPTPARAANTRGHALHEKKKSPEAAVEDRAAIAQDPSYLRAPDSGRASHRGPTISTPRSESPRGSPTVPEVIAGDPGAPRPGV
ncbi:MAG TPA: hypothetical protein VFK02_26365 [Kofleriaceae bacterium]|nr:hypothetical protein [Kofleriaceae bacterium]